MQTTQALITDHLFYALGVSSAGKLENRLHGTYWGEKHESLPDENCYLERIRTLQAFTSPAIRFGHGRSR